MGCAVNSGEEDAPATSWSGHPELTLSCKEGLTRQAPESTQRGENRHCVGKGHVHACCATRPSPSRPSPRTARSSGAIARWTAPSSTPAATCRACAPRCAAWASRSRRSGSRTRTSTMPAAPARWRARAAADHRAAPGRPVLDRRPGTAERSCSAFRPRSLHAHAWLHDGDTVRSAKARSRPPLPRPYAGPCGLRFGRGKARVRGRRAVRRQHRPHRLPRRGPCHADRQHHATAVADGGRHRIHPRARAGEHLRARAADEPVRGRRPDLPLLAGLVSTPAWGWPTPFPQRARANSTGAGEKCFFTWKAVSAAARSRAWACRPPRTSATRAANCPRCP